MSSLNHAFVASSSAPGDLVVSGDFYDFKRYLKSIVNINLANSSRVVTHYSIQINNTTANTTTTPVNVVTLLSKGETSTEKKVEVEIIHSALPSPTLKDGNIEYAFTDGNNYCIKHNIAIKEIVNGTTQTYNYSYHQDFRYYATPVTLSDFTFNDIQNGDTLKITGLTLAKASSYSPADSTYPQATTISGITNYPMRFTIQEKEISSDSCESVDTYYEMGYESNGNYDLSDIQLTIGKNYKVSVEASWLLGYSTSKESSQPLSILSRPVITAVDIADLYLYDPNADAADVVTITISPITSPANLVSKIWFEFYTTSGDNLILQARAGGGATDNGFAVTSDSNVSTNNVYPLKLSDFSSGSLNNTEYYKVKAKVKYALGEYRTSASFPAATAEYKNFTNTIPEIVSSTINSLYTIGDPSNGKILDIVVKNEAYQLVAPNKANGIMFHFYDGATRVASTSPYTFVNSLNGGDHSYPILLSDVTSNVLVNDKDYRIKAEVVFTGISSRLSELDTTAPLSDKVNFAKTIPEIVSSTINSLYTIGDPSNGKILDIEVKNDAYQLVAPNEANGIMFHFYDESVSTTTPVASTSSYTFVNSSGGSNHSYPILLSDVTSNVLVNDKDYRIKAEVAFTGISSRLSELDTTTPLSDKVKFSLKYPVINTITEYDFYNDGNTGDSVSQVIATIVVPHQSYELVAPNTASGIRFLIYASDESTLVATTDYYTFVNSSDSTAVKGYDIKLNELNFEVGYDELSNGLPGYRVKAEVTIVKHSGVPVPRVSEDFDDLIGTQNVVALTSVTISNSWALATDDDPTSSSTRFNTSPPIGISGYFKKTLQFNPANYTRHLDVGTTKFKIEYKVGSGNWQYVQKGLLLQKSSSESLQEAVSRANTTSPLPVTNGKFDNVVTTDPDNNDYQEEMIFFIPQQQVGASAAFTESNNVQVQITIDDSVNIWGSTGNGSVSAATASNSLQLIKKINTYNYVAGQSSEPWNSTSNGNLFLNIPVDWDSIHAHSVKVGVKYSSSNSDGYIYQTFAAPTSEVQISVDPNQGTTLYYSVAYIVNNVNLVSPATTQGLTAEKIVSNKFFPSSTDYTIATTSYKTFNSGGKSSITFDLAFNATSTSTSGIDGVNVYFTSTGITKTRIGSYAASQGETGKTIQLLHPGATINYASASDNNTPLNIINASGTIEASSSWGDFDSASISFEAYRYSRVESTAVYGTTYYVESGSSGFGKTIWNVPVLTSPSGPSGSGSITLVGGVRNSSTATKLSWPHVSVPNAGNLTYDLTMKKNAESSFIHNNVDSDALVANEKTLTIEADANAKYTITLASVFAPTTTGAMREVSATPDTIEFHTIYVDVSNINISVQNPSTTSKVNLSFSDAVVSGDYFNTSGVVVSASFTNIDEQHVIYSTTNPTNALTRLASAESNALERIVSPATKKEYTLPVLTLATLYSFFMKLKAHISYKVNTTISQTPAVEISTQTTQTDLSQYKVSSIPIIGSSFTTTIDPLDERPVLNFSLDANGLEDEGFISVVVIIGQDGTPDKVEGESVILVFPDTGAVSDYSNDVAGSGSASLDSRLAGGEYYTSSPRSLTGAVMLSSNGTLVNDIMVYPSYTYTLTIGDVTTLGGRYANSSLKMPASSDSGFSDGQINMWILATTRRGTDFSALVATYSPPAIVRNLNITGSGDDFYANFDLNNA